MKLKTLRFGTAFVALFMAIAANAANFPADGSAIKIGEVYTVKSFATCNATLTSPTSGTLTQDGCPAIEIVDAAGKTLNKEFVSYSGKYGQVYNWVVEAGVTYSVKNTTMVMDDEKVCFTMVSSQQLEVSSVNPPAGASLSTTTNFAGDVFINTNVSAQISKAYIIAPNGNVAAAEVMTATGNQLCVRVAAALTTLYNNGSLSKKGGEDITLKLEGLKNADGVVYNKDGVYEIKYISAAKALDLVSTNVNNTTLLKSFFVPGAEGSVLTFTFDGDVSAEGAYAVISAGDPAYEGSYYYEELPATGSGQTISVDLSGKLRDLNSLIGDGGSVGFKVTGVRDIDGNLAEGQGYGPGSYSFSLTYEYIEPVTVASEFTPGSGSSLNGVSEIEIWFNNSSKIQYDGVLFEHPEGSVVVTKADCNITVDGEDTTIKVAVPEAIKGTKCVTVSLNNCYGLDGYDHAIRAFYDQFVVTLVSPIQPGQALASTGEDDFVVTFSDESYGYYRYDFYNGNPETADGWIYGSWFTKQEDGTWTAYNGNYPCFTSFDPYMLIRAYNSEADYWDDQDNGNNNNVRESFTFNFKGTQRGFDYSTYKFISIDPEENSLITPSEDFHFTVEFEGLVRLDPKYTGIALGMGQGLKPFEKMERLNVTDEDPEGYASVWALYPSYEYLTTVDGLDVSIKAYDVEGLLIQGNMGGNENDYLSFSYAVLNTANYREIVVTPADGEELPALDVFNIKSATDYYFVGVNYNYTGSYPTISDENGIVYQFTEDDVEVYAEIVGDDDGMGNPVYDYDHASINLKLAEKITTPGTYTLNVPEGIFEVGSQADVQPNKSLTATYEVVKQTTGIGVTIIESAAVYEVYSIAGVHVMSTTDVNDLAKLPAGIYVINGVKVKL